MRDWLKTAEAVRVVSEATGAPLSERDVNNMVRAWPIALMPPVVGNRRRWHEEHVARLRAEVEARTAKVAG